MFVWIELGGLLAGLIGILWLRAWWLGRARPSEAVVGALETYYRSAGSVVYVTREWEPSAFAEEGFRLYKVSIATPGGVWLNPVVSVSEAGEVRA